jgi:hypothetical protein
MKKYIFYLIPVFVGFTFTISAQIKGLGLVMDNEAYAKTPLINKPQGFGKNLPKSFSLKQYCPNIGDQGLTGTCTAWSSTYYAATMEFAILNNITSKDAITALAFDPYYTYLNIISDEEEQKKTCEDGTYIGDACDFLMNYGSKRVAIDMYDCNSKSSASINREAYCPVDYTDYVRLFSMYYGTQVDEFDVVIESVCQSLVNKHPVIIGMDVIESFANIDSDGFFDSSNGGQESLGGHAMTVVGYDDNKHGGCFTVVNSWGSGWGEKGYLYITYEDFYKYTWYAFALETQLKSMDYAGCNGGNCDSGYGVMKYNTKKLQGTFEGLFDGGKMFQGIYTNYGTISSKEMKNIQKIVKKHGYGARYIMGNSGNIIGFILD